MVIGVRVYAELGELKCRDGTFGKERAKCIMGSKNCATNSSGNCNETA